MDVIPKSIFFMGNLVAACGMRRPGRAAVNLKRWSKMRVLMPREDILQVRLFLTQSLVRVVLQKSIPVQIRQFIQYISNDEGYVKG